jgi:hypothetical protein
VEFLAGFAYTLLLIAAGATIYNAVFAIWEALHPKPPESPNEDSPEWQEYINRKTK